MGAQASATTRSRLGREDKFLIGSTGIIFIALVRRAAEEHRLVKYLRNVPSWNFLFLYMLAGNVDRRWSPHLTLVVTIIT